MATDRVTLGIRAAVVGMCLAASTACAGASARTESYNNTAEARADGAIEQGWVPSWLPPGAHGIRVAYQPSGRERWGLFNFVESDIAAVKEGLEPEPVPLAGTRLDVPGRIEWWPLALRGDLDAEALGLVGLTGYRTTDRRFIVAVNWRQGRAYFWVVSR